MPTQDSIARPAQLASAVLGGLIALSTLPGLWVGLMGNSAWEIGSLPLFAAFEALVLLSAGFAVVFGIRPRREGYGLAMLCAAGGILTASVLGAIVLKNSSSKVPPLTNYVMVRAAAAAGLGILTGVVMLGRSITSWKYATIGGVMLLPSAILGGLIITKKAEVVLAWVNGLGPPWPLILALVAAIVWGVLTVIGGHLVIRAFELTDQNGLKDG